MRLQKTIEKPKSGKAQPTFAKQMIKIHFSTPFVYFKTMLIPHTKRLKSHRGNSGLACI